MKLLDVTELLITTVPNDELPHRVEIVGKSGATVKGAGITLAGACLTAFSVSGMFPTKDYPWSTHKELARFIFWNFGGGGNWVKVIGALTHNK